MAARESNEIDELFDSVLTDDERAESDEVLRQMLGQVEGDLGR